MNATLVIDYALVGLIGATAGLSLFKFIDIWRPRWSRMPSVDETLANDPAAGMLQLERGLLGLHLIATLAPFLGLMGTVMHIMAALTKLSGGASLQAIAGPVGASLQATLYGLVSAMLATAVYSLCNRKLAIIESLTPGAPESK